jgi:DNA-binding MarR family transcriptional regulator
MTPDNAARTRGEQDARDARRARAVTRFLELRPAVLALMRASAPDELRAGFDSLTPRQLQALALLPDEGIGMQQLATALGITAPTASTLAARLVAQGLAIRIPGADRRVVRLAPSDRGREMAGRYRQVQRQAADGIFDRLTDRQGQSLLALMEILARELPEVKA